MLVFVDESGNTGMKLDRPGTSPFFVVTAVVFEDRDEAALCDQAITRLRESLGWHTNAEFHFNKMSRDLRIRFLAHVAQFEFVYFAVVFNKKKMTGPGFQFQAPFNKYAVNLVFQNAKRYLSNATVIIDGKGERVFRQQLQTYLKKRINEGGQSLIQKVKIEASHRNNLLQLADVLCGSIARTLKADLADARDYRRIVKHREMTVQVWPR